MTIILFLIDTSASMNQRTYLGARPTLLDVAKDAVERFIKIRQRDSASRGDRYMLLTFEDPPHNIKAGWKENLATFMTELKNLQSVGMTTLGAALKYAFDLLNINRMHTCIDTYGQGRCPFYLEPSIIIVITDGGRLTTTLGVQEELNLPMHSSVPGSELTKEPFRWDQRLFSLVLRLTGIPPAEREPSSVVPPDNSPVDAMCEVTGGRSYAVISQRMLMQCLESLVQKLQSGVVINFEKFGPDPPPLNNEEIQIIDDRTNSKPASPSVHPNPNNQNQNGTASPPLYGANNNSWHSCRKLIYVQRSAQKGYTVGHWPIPEAFWPDQNSPGLPPRSAHPIVKFSCANSEPMVIDNLPFDKYELEPSPLTQYILSRKQPTVAWQVFVSNCYKNSEIDHPFGYLKASTSLTCVNLFVLPFNYPVLLPMLDDLFKVHRCKPTREWKQQFDTYVKNMPLYYAHPLKRALQRMGAPNLVPDTMENCLSYNIINYLKRLKNQAKTEFEKLIATIGSKKTQSDGIRVNPAPQRPFGSATKLTEMNLTPNLIMNERFTALKNELSDFNGFVLFVKDREIKHESYRNAYDIPRNNILDQLARMRSNFLQSSLSHTRLQDEDQMHSLAVSQMGNYQEYLKRLTPPLREIESIPVRQHMFGNPFKIDKRMMVDEADIDPVAGSGGASPVRGQKRPMDSIVGSPRAKRKPGPLPKDFPVWRPQSPSPMIPNLNTLPPEVDILPHNLPSESEDDMFSMEKDRSPPTLSPVEDGIFTWNNTSDMQMMNHVNSRNVNHVDSWEEEDGDLTMPALNMNCTNDISHYFQDSLFRTEMIRVRSALFKEVRKPGRNFEQLFKQLELVDNNLDIQIFMVREVISEAFRFKRKYLVKLLEDFEQNLLQSNNRLTHIDPPTYSR
ncbi:integrator complex subunit 6-like [Uloborus diversus]|uniref:integrator complex subunit 6-like n=1 Tax=Uloborus diversus TaxID=327109 RepID=UPI0024093C9A|nr:integrator complex subunit 6-like [Uloborus diversus]